MEGTTPFGVAAQTSMIPKVAAPQQPWAGDTAPLALNMGEQNDGWRNGHSSLCPERRYGFLPFLTSSFGRLPMMGHAQLRAICGGRKRQRRASSQPGQRPWKYRHISPQWQA